MDEQVIKEIYLRLGDEESKIIFANRLLYSLTGDRKWVDNMVSQMADNYFYNWLDGVDGFSQKSEMIMFGAGNYGVGLYRITKGYNWKYFVDNNPKSEQVEGLPLISFEDFLNRYSGEYIFISPFFYHEEMYEQLLTNHIPKEKIIDMGIYYERLQEAQYFDLECLKQSEKDEVFVDLGVWDGMTSVRFKEWAGENSYVYAFEPDENRIDECIKNLEKNNVKYELIQKGVWSTTTKLQFDNLPNGCARISNEGESVVDVVALDDILMDRHITFIKMDIEGSEYEAIMGAKGIIEKYHPKMAVCVYHKFEDIWKLPKLILEYNPNYKLYFRHYNFFASETVMYAIDETE